MKRTVKNRHRWRNIKPHTMKQRKNMYKRYGKRCFLLPKELKYPVCNKYTGKMECVGLLAAQNRAALSVYRRLKPKSYSYKKIMNKAKKLRKSHRCNSCRYD